MACATASEKTAASSLYATLRMVEPHLLLDLSPRTTASGSQTSTSSPRLATLEPCEQLQTQLSSRTSLGEELQLAGAQAAADTTDLELYFTSQARRPPSGCLPQTPPMSMDILCAAWAHLRKLATAQYTQMLYRADRRAGRCIGHTSSSS